MWHDIFKSYADAISVATMQRPSVDRPRPVDEAALLGSELRRDRASPTGIAGRIGQRVVAWVRQSRHPAVAGIHAIDIIQPPGIVIPPIADMDAHQMIATAALTAKSSAEKPKKARFSDAKADLLDALMRVLDADFDALPAPRQEALMAESMELRYGLPRCLKQSDRLTNTM